MSSRSKTPTIDDHYCRVCSLSSSASAGSTGKRLSSYACEHCHVPMCYECFHKHTAKLIDEYSQLQKRFSSLSSLFDTKRQTLSSFEEHCTRSVNAAFDEVLNDLQILRGESINYVKQQFKDTEIILSSVIEDVKPLINEAQTSWSREGITKQSMAQIDKYRRQLLDIEHRLDILSSPTMLLKMSTFPRNKLDLQCRLFDSSISSKKFSALQSGRMITTRCSCGSRTDSISEKIDVDTEVEEIGSATHAVKQIQTDPIIEPGRDTDEDEDDYFSIHDETSELSNRINAEHCLSTRYALQGTILTQNEVDRLASDGEHLLYFSEISKSLCYVSSLLSNKRADGISITKEASCRWPHSAILDLIWSPGSSQYVCATRTGVYTCTVDPNDTDSTIDIQMQLKQHWSYVRLSADKNHVWLWTDTDRSSQLQIYSPKTFDCIKTFNLHDYPRFSDNSTSFCAQSNRIATVFQFKQLPPSTSCRKNFHVTLCDSTDLRELCTIRLGECDIDHEIRANNEGTFFITNGKRKLWIIDGSGNKEYVKLLRTGRALAVHSSRTILIANGTQQIQCVELLQNDNAYS